MSIGLYDNDLMNHDYDFFNLELMKIAKFYKGRREIVKLSPLFTPDSYTKFILRKDSDLNNLPTDFFNYSKIQYGGRYFSEKYQPIDGEEYYPDKTIYLDKENYFRDKALFKSMMSGEHFRLSLDGETINPLFTKDLLDLSNDYSIFCYDYDITSIAGAHEAIIDLLEYRKGIDPLKTHIGFKFPLQFNDFKTLLLWQNLRYKVSATIFNINFPLTAQELIFFSEQQKVNPKIINYNPFTQRYTDELWVSLYNQLLYAINWHLPINLIADNLSNRNKQIARLLNRYLIWAYKCQEKTHWGYSPPFLDFCKTLKNEEKTSAREIMKIVRYNYPNFFEHLQKYHYGEAKEELMHDWS